MSLLSFQIIQICLGGTSIKSVQSLVIGNPYLSKSALPLASLCCALFQPPSINDKRDNKPYHTAPCDVVPLFVLASNDPNLLTPIGILLEATEGLLATGETTKSDLPNEPAVSDSDLTIGEKENDPARAVLGLEKLKGFVRKGEGEVEEGCVPSVRVVEIGESACPYIGPSRSWTSVSSDGRSPLVFPPPSLVLKAAPNRSESPLFPFLAPNSASALILKSAGYLALKLATKDL